MNIYRPMIKISKDCTMNVARLKDIPYFEWDHVVYDTRTLEEVCKAHQVPYLEFLQDEYGENE